MSVTKSYTKHDVATKICAKKNDGLDTPAWEVKEIDGKFQILAIEAPKPEITETVTETQSDDTVHTETSTEVVTAPKPSAPAVNQIEAISVFIGGAYLTNQYVITPTLGSQPRWFERKRLIDAVSENGGVTITCLPKEFTSRGLGALLQTAPVQADTDDNKTEPSSEEDAGSDLLPQEVTEQAPEQAVA